jgi:hypothetical protein
MAETHSHDLDPADLAADFVAEDLADDFFAGIATDIANLADDDGSGRASAIDFASWIDFIAGFIKEIFARCAAAKLDRQREEFRTRPNSRKSMRMERKIARRLRRKNEADADGTARALVAKMAACSDAEWAEAKANGTSYDRSDRP